MNLRHTLPGLSLAVAFVAGMGCEKSGPVEPSLKPTPLSQDTTLRAYWRGKNDLGVAASAYYFMRIWELPQSARVEMQTLVKLSTVPWRLSQGRSAVTNQAAALLYPLLADMVWNESYLEIRQPANQPANFVFAIRLNPSREPLWQTNLAAVAESLTDGRAVPASDGRFGWSLEKREAPTYLSLTRVSEWILVSAGPTPNALLDDVTARIQRDHTPYVSQKSGDWLEAYADLPRLRVMLPDWNLPAGLPEVSVAVNGDGGHVLTHAELTFPQPLPSALPSWNIPTNLMHPPLITFTAARAFKPSLASWKTWNDFQIGPPPDQFYSWALPGGLFRTYFAAPLPNADAEVRALAGYFIQKSNPWLALHNYIGFAPGPDSNGVTWGNSPSIKPFIQSVAADDAGGVAYGGLIPETGTVAQTNLFYDHPSFPELLQDVSARTNLVYYHWELTGDRIESCLYISQFLSAITRCAPLPLDSASAVWFKTAMPRLGNCTTTVTLASPDRLCFDRQSTVGFTAAELNLLAVWLESPQFPWGLHIFPVASQP